MTQSVLLAKPDLRPSPFGSAPLKNPGVKTVLTGIFLAGLVMFGAECLRVFVGINLHVVIPGKCYRAGQPSADVLETIKTTHGIRTVLNLRDENEDEDWYQEEKDAAGRLGLKLIDAGLSSREQPPAKDFRHFVRALDACEEPVLIHCANGNDRTGLASAIYLLMRTDMSTAEARRQLSIRYGHFFWTESACLHRLLDSYEAWLQQGNRVHTADNFREWAFTVYRQEKRPRPY